MSEWISLFEAREFYGVTLLDLRRMIRLGRLNWHWHVRPMFEHAEHATRFERRGRKIERARLEQVLGRETMIALGADIWVTYNEVWQAWAIKRGWLDGLIRMNRVKVCMLGLDKGKYSLRDIMREAGIDVASALSRWVDAP